MMGPKVAMMDASMGEVQFIPKMKRHWFPTIPKSADTMTQKKSAFSILSLLENKETIQKTNIENVTRIIISEDVSTHCASKTNFVNTKFPPKSNAAVSIAILPTSLFDTIQERVYISKTAQRYMFHFCFVYKTLWFRT